MFELPKSWQLIRFADFIQEVSTGPFGTMIHKQDYINDGVPLINPSHMIDSKIVEDVSISVGQEKARELSAYNIFTNDIVMARRGELGRCALVTQRENGWLCGTGSFVLKFHQEVSRKYILMLFKSDFIRSYLGGNSIGTTMTNLNHSILNKMPIGVPPTNEQHRIVTKVSQLLSLCDTLKANLNQAQTTQTQLADTMVKQAVN